MNTLTEDNNYTYEYDANGNLKRKIHKQTKAMQYYTWNDFNQLREVYKASKENEYIYILRFSYDGFGRRIRKQYIDKIDESKSFYHRYLYHNENIIAILDANDNRELLASIVHHPTQVDTPLSITNHETQRTYYYHRDHHGSIVALTNEEGQTIESIDYDGHYGKILNHTKEEVTLNPYGYTGRETDMDDLYYYRARYYDPQTQRFLSRDPIEFQAGDFNFYRYVGNDCVNFRDPSGLDPRLNGRGVPAGMGGNADKESDGWGPFSGGCGAEGTKLATWIPDISPDACKEHDDCYAKCGSDKSECDRIFFMSNPYYAVAVILSEDSSVAFKEAQKDCPCGK
jgi:RHS repeat-associated protein